MARPKLTQKWAAKMARELYPHIMEGTKEERLQHLASALLLAANGTPRNSPYGSVKKVIMNYAKRHERFSVDDLCEKVKLPALTSRKSLVSNLNWLAKQKELICAEPSVRGRNGHPTFYSLPKGR